MNYSPNYMNLLGLFSYVQIQENASLYWHTGTRHRPVRSENLVLSLALISVEPSKNRLRIMYRTSICTIFKKQNTLRNAEVNFTKQRGNGSFQWRAVRTDWNAPPSTYFIFSFKYLMKSKAVLFGQTALLW